MEKRLGMTIKSLVFFKVKFVVKKFSIFHEKNYGRILKIYVEIEFAILSFKKHVDAQYIEVNFYIMF